MVGGGGWQVVGVALDEGNKRASGSASSPALIALCDGGGMSAQLMLNARRPSLVGGSGETQPVLLFMGIIDVLQSYDLSKKLESACVAVHAPARGSRATSSYTAARKAHPAALGSTALTCPADSNSAAGADTRSAMCAW